MMQRTEEWFNARKGKVTASRVADVIAKTKSGTNERRRSYMLELIAERLQDEIAEHFCSPAMQWGVDNEGMARSAYEAITGQIVEEVGFIDHPSILMSGASPDGLVGADGILEIKCPTTSTHIDTLLSKAVDSRYLAQISWQLECTGRAWADFVSFDPRVPFKHQLFIKRITREELPIDSTREEVIRFLAELDAEMGKL